MKWVRQDAEGDAPANLLTQAERQELIELRRKLKQVQSEHDILAKAGSKFAHNGATTSPGSMR